MFRKSHHFGWLLASQNEPNTLIWDVFFGLSCLTCFCFFDIHIFQKTLFYESQSIILMVSRLSICFIFVCFFCFFVAECFLRGPELAFSDFGRFLGPPKSTLTFQKTYFYLGESTIFNKSCFFIKNRVSTQNIICSPFWTQRSRVQNLKMDVIFCARRHRNGLVAGRPPAAPMGPMGTHSLPLGGFPYSPLCGSHFPLFGYLVQ